MTKPIHYQPTPARRIQSGQCIHGIGFIARVLLDFGACTVTVWDYDGQQHTHPMNATLLVF